MSNKIEVITSLGGITKNDWDISVSQHNTSGTVLIVVFHRVFLFCSTSYFATTESARTWIALITGDDMLDFLE